MTEERLIDKIIDVSLRRGFICPTAEIYGGAGGFYDYGPLGTLLKQKIVDYWRQNFVLDTDNIFEVSGSLLMPESVFQASGHLDAFDDPLTQCSACNSMFRTDLLINEAANISAEGLSIEEQDKLIQEHNVKCPKCKEDLSKSRNFNLMFKTEIGPSGGYAGYLRPETAQNIFINFKRLTAFMRNKLPFGIAQTGFSFRNEISPRNFIIRLRQFEQMEIEMFFDPDEKEVSSPFEVAEDLKINFVTHEMQEKGWEKPLSLSLQEVKQQNLVPNDYLLHFLALETEMLIDFGVKQEDFWFRHMLPHETPHYSGGNFDLEVNLSIGHKEIIGNAYRRDYDLKKHSKASNSSFAIAYSDGRKVLPHVVEPSLGVDRILYTVLEKCYREDDRGWSWFQFPSVIAPLEVAVFPLMKKDGLANLAYEVHRELKNSGYLSFYDESGKIGKRYARADEIGIPYCITIDYDTLKDSSLTIRDRDSMKQIRIPLENLDITLGELMDSEVEFEDSEQ